MTHDGSRDPDALPLSDQPTLADTPPARPNVAAGAHRTHPDAALAQTAGLENAVTLPNAGGVRAGSTPDLTVERLGRYVILELLGEGGMGRVYAAYDPQLDRKVAIKLLHHGADSELARARLLREAQAMAQLSRDPHVVTIYDVGMFQGHIFMAMELISGTTLSAWAKGKRPAWRQIVDMYIQAGHGLAAAHQADLVHRDFKPDNVLIDGQGRAQVMDFGLAYRDDAGDDEPLLRDDDARPAADEDEPWRGQAAARWSDSARRSYLSTRLTITGAFVGTPAYMAPEQFQGEPVDARTDQFSFCASLYESLYGQAPFAGDTRYELADQVVNGSLRQPPAGHGVPGWVHQIMRRGLETRKEDRWPSMDALLQALARDPGKRRRRVLGLCAAAVATGLLSLGIARHQSTAQSTCRDAESQLAGVWSSDRKSAVEQAMMAPDLPYAGATWQRVRSTLDEYAGALGAQAVEVCEARRRGARSDRLLDLQIGCLHRRAGELRAIIDVLARGDAEVTQNAVSTVSELGSLERCADADALLAQVEPPADAATAAAVASLRDDLASVRVSRIAGQYRSAASAAASTVERARALDYRPVLAEALYEQGYALMELGHFDDADKAISEALRHGLATGDQVIAARSAVLLVNLLGAHLERFEAAALRAEDARALLERSPASEPLHAEFLSNLALLRTHQGEFDQALEYQGQALAIREQTLGREHLEVAQSLNSIGMLLSKRGKYAEAETYLQRALEIEESTLGPDHPEVATLLHNIAIVVAQQQEYERALALQARVIDIRERSLGPDNPELATTLGNMGKILEELERYQEARDKYERALEILTRTLGQEHSNVAWALASLGSVLARLGEHERARDAFERALAIRERALGKDHPKLAYTLTSYAKLEHAAGSQDAAIALLERALRVAEGKLPGVVPETQFLLARALDRTGRDGRRALAMAERARDSYAGLGEDLHKKQIDEIEAWLRQRRR